ncbi:LytR/AlgR family response regulator transcription factor [Pontibacter actiniarum]|uniref:DNA-binding response regulator n=1 Tax=Pontibacter actiniarum TaxID=323450 RepID=A0A1X9YQP7_9BACT|nr:LytTR family DNA-binding domain-containing protein [Pontibacter actiniarum]ARS35193.1 DNA-binding response regulator [Pontibacter actiniarum]
MIKCLLVDDEPLAHQVLEHYIAQIPALVVVGKCRHAIEAHEFLSSNTVDLLFLDVEMPLVNGIHFLKTTPQAPKTILTTAFKAYAYEGYELDVVDYLLKPFSFERFSKAIEKYYQSTSQNQVAPTQEKHLLVKDLKGLTKINYNDVLYIEARKDYMQIVTTTKTYLLHETMKALAAQLADENFVRVHRSYLVALEQIKFLQNDVLTLCNGTKIPIGSAYKQELLDKFKR